MLLAKRALAFFDALILSSGGWYKRVTSSAMAAKPMAAKFLNSLLAIVCDLTQDFLLSLWRAACRRGAPTVRCFFRINAVTSMSDPNVGPGRRDRCVVESDLSFCCSFADGRSDFSRIHL